MYEAICDYKKYGYRSESHMVIDAVRRFIQDGESDIDIDKLADRIAQKLSGKLTVSTTSQSVSKTEDAPTEKAAFDAALSFLDSF